MTTRNEDEHGRESEKPNGTRLPLVDPVSGRDTESGAVRVAGVLLAAGTGSRFGSANKLLATIDGTPLVRLAARTLIEAGLTPLVAVVGYESDRVASALDGLPFEIVENPAYETGQATSVRAAVDALTDETGSDDGATVDAAVFALGDMPSVAPATVRTLVDVYTDSSELTALAAAFEGRRGNPVLFDARHFAALADVSGDVGGREILLREAGSALVETGDPGVRRDVDTPRDLDRLR